jgi:hypothetical protein
MHSRRRCDADRDLRLILGACALVHDVHCACDQMQGNNEEGTMESVKVDAQKLQILNERLAQTIEALNQVRMSMHGIQQHQPTTAGSMPFTPFGYAYPYAATPFVPSYGYGYGTPFGPGISHTTAPTPWQATPWQQTPWTTTPWQQTAPWQTTPWQTMPWQQTTPWQTMPWQQTAPWQTAQTQWPTTQQPWPTTGNGISHSTWETPAWQTQMPRQWTWAW